MNQIYFDPTDQASMNMLMDEHGDSKTMYPGTNEYGGMCTFRFSTIKS